MEDALHEFIANQTKEIDADMQHTAAALTGVEDEKNITDILYELYWKYPDGPGVYRANASGDVIVTVPYTSMNDALNNPELQAIMESSFSNATDLRLEGPVYTQAYGEVMCLILPVYTVDGVYDGYICLGQSPEILTNRVSLCSADSCERYDVWIARPDGTVLWHPNSDLIGHNIQTSHLFDEFRPEMLPILEKSEGETSYRYRVLGYDTTVLEKQAVWRTVEIGGAPFRVVLINYHYVNPEVVLPENMTDVYLQDIVRSMYLYAGSHSKEQTFTEINDPNGLFAEKGVLTFAYDMNGTVLAHSTLPHMIGEQRLNYREAYSATNPIISMISRASQGGGFTHYYTPIPYSDHMATFDLCYVQSVDDTWFVGASIPVTDTLFTYSVETRDELHKNLENARKYLNEHGMEKTLEELMNPSGAFQTNNSSMFAAWYNGTLLTTSDILPYEIGENTFSMVSYHGGSIGREFVILAKSGGGFTYYDTDTGVYLIYIEPVDDTWYIGTGVRVGDSHPST
ncbi:cache domain-containing protein [Methanorbis rubei]